MTHDSIIYYNLSWNNKFIELVLMALFSRGYADVETNECLENNGGCWMEKASNVTACKVHFVGIELLSSDNTELFRITSSDFCF